MTHILRLLGMVAVLAGIIGLPVQPVEAEDVVVTLAPGQSVTIPLDLWCLNYGAPFPTSIEGPTDRPSDEVVKVMQTAIRKGTVTTDITERHVRVAGRRGLYAGEWQCPVAHLPPEPGPATHAAPNRW